ncbi:beta-1,6-N-acetylglucosaminyltransferase [Fibrella sp. WM1]|uniref:beta-1,6-N-acetylglucosaminyltransferase n=1 Tax=Fibrella musci TaxID=3242485 RepID=UPI0035202FB0
MKIAYIVTAYTDPQQLRRLVDSLNSNAHFFIHIDSKVDIVPFKNQLSDYTNVFFTKNRFFINWGGFAQVLSQQELLASVFESKLHFDRVVCLSGTDYPLWSTKMIFDEFSKNSKKEYIQAVNLTKLENSIQTRKVVLYHFLRDIKIKNYFIKKCFSGSARLLFRALPFRKSPTTLIEGKQVDVYFGSDYWALTIDCARDVYNKLLKEDELINYFKHSYIPSEMCIQTIVFNSEFGKNAILTPKENYDNLHSLTPLHHIEYHGMIKVFDETDFEALAANRKMFFRKALTGRSDKLLVKIDALRSERDSLKN